MSISKKASALVLQSGGPTAVINQSLHGVVVASRDYAKIDRVLGAYHGLHGLLHENLIDLTQIDGERWKQIAACPGAALGSARLKPKKSDLDRVFEVFKAHNIQYVFYNGGNDSAEAAQLIRAEANARGVEIGILHIPKTIDNDLMETDHCPGFGSAARVASLLAAGDDLDNMSFYNGVKINIAMGRHTGWIAAGSALARHCFGDELENAAPHLVYFPEVKFNETSFLNDVQRTYDRLGRVTLVVSEGIADQFTGDAFVGNEKDEFGNPLFSGSGRLGDYLVHIVEKNLKIKSELGKLRARADTWGYMQRSILGITSENDAKDAFRVGADAVGYMMAGKSDSMVTIVRKSSEPYACQTSLCDLALVAQKTRYLPEEFMNSAKNGVSDAFLQYAAPLVGRLPAAQTLPVNLSEKRLSEYKR